MFRILVSLAHLALRAHSTQAAQHRAGAKERQIAAKKQRAQDAYDGFCREQAQIRKEKGIK